MPPTPADILQKADAPKTVVIDGNSATAQGPDDYRKWLELANSAEAGLNQKPSIRQFKLVPPGSV